MLGNLLGAASGVASSKLGSQNAVDKTANFIKTESTSKAEIEMALLQKQNLEQSVKETINKAEIEQFNAGKRGAEAVTY